MASTTAGQSSSPAVITCPRYLNAITFYNSSPKASKFLSVLSLNSTSANRRLFCSAPLAQYAVAGCLPFSVLQGTIMLHWGHRGWRRFPSSKMTMMSRKCRCRKWTRIAVLAVGRPGHPSNGQLCVPPLAVKSMQYVHRSSPMAKVFQLLIYSSARPCCVILFPAKDPISTPSHHSLHWACPFCLSW